MDIDKLVKKTCRICGETFYCKGKCSNPEDEECRCWFCVAKYRGKKPKEIAEYVCDVRAKVEVDLKVREKVTFT